MNCVLGVRGSSPSKVHGVDRKAVSIVEGWKPTMGHPPPPHYPPGYPQEVSLCYHDRKVIRRGAELFLLSLFNSVSSRVNVKGELLPKPGSCLAAVGAPFLVWTFTMSLTLNC